MAGGSGTRLWPLSRSLFPKQFLSLTSDESMLQQTINRTASFDGHNAIFLCNENHRFLVAEQLREIDYHSARIILEPAAKNTAPAIALAALDVLHEYGDGLLMVMAADHVIENEQSFADAVLKAVSFAKEESLVTFGIVPKTPETGYGYIHRGKQKGENGFQVAEFVEKPDLATAIGYLDSGDYYWNSGMFMFKASAYIKALEEFAPRILASCREAYDAKEQDLDFIRVGKEAFLATPEDSIDYAVMEKTTKAVVVPMDAGWSDVGSWSALWDINEKDANGNSSTGDVILHDSKNSLVHSTHRLVATAGLENTVIVETKDAVLVAAKDKVQDVKHVVKKLKNVDRPEFKHHRDVYRPWGFYDSIDESKRYKVKRITVKPGAKLSVQMHYHRAEHWVVVSGTAKVTVNGESQLISENQSTYIPVGAVHCLENPGKVDLELIEVQSGAYFGEDDIVRLEDRYGRAEGK
jgi:mannose-1-phosphate guanylyltransferase